MSLGSVQQGRKASLIIGTVVVYKLYACSPFIQPPDCGDNITTRYEYYLFLYSSTVQVHVGA